MITTNYGWNLPDWEMSSGQNAALVAVDAELKVLSDGSTSQAGTIDTLTTDIGTLTTSVGLLDTAVGGVNTLLTPHTTTLIGGSKVVSNSTITTANKIIYSRTNAGAGALGNLSYSIIDNTSITFTSDAVTDASTIAYIIL